VTEMSVELVKTEISPDILDTIGKSFRFRHGSGIAEWLKNALDQYLRLREMGLEPRAGNWPVFLVLIDGSSQSNGPNLAVVDLAGTWLKHIEGFFLLWGSRSAATLGRSVDASSVTGGHGNGGKFYMREMWRSGARFLTHRDGKTSSLVVEKRGDGNTGFWECKERRTDWREALALALPESDRLGGAASLVSHLEAHEPDLVSELEKGTRGVTVVAGRRAVQALSSNDVVRGGRWDEQRLVDSIRDAAQARRPIRELAISVFINGHLRLARLVPERVEDDPDWPATSTMVPASVIADTGLRGDAPEAGELRIQKAAVPLTGRLRERNTLSVLDEHGNPIALYSVAELPLAGHSPLLPFMHGELQLGFPGLDDLIQNDREKLVSSETTKELLQWVADQVWDRVKGIEDSIHQAAKKTNLEIASILNDHLNEHARRFLEELQTQIAIDVIDDPEGGGSGSHGGGGSGRGGGGTGGPGGGGPREIPGDTEHVKRPRFPQVLLSGHDINPATAASASPTTKFLTDRHPPLDQDDEDRLWNIWWINTEHVFAKEAIEYGGPQGLAFKNHQLHMFRDVVQREALRLRQRRDAELSLDRVENELAEITNRFLAELPRDLVASILTERR
jgi:hypothetical protein